jgi:cyclopropane fatty-acyl-phospholipid synthase-like methyltransferase
MTSFHFETFTHITCFYYTLYYIKNKDHFFYNVYQWLTPGGLFIVHLANKCEYGKPSITDKKYTYKRTIKENKVYENITYKNKIRRNEHTFYMENIPFILELAKNSGFSLVSSEKYDLHQFIYIFKKSK